MDSDFIEVIGSQPTRPAEIDVTSSEVFVYERKNIQKYEERDEEENIIFSGWKYLERKLSKTQWTLEVAVQNKQNLDAIMLGLTDLYELEIGG